MMRFLIFAILLAFPFAEIFLLVNLSNLYGWKVLFYLVVVGYLGLQLIKGEKLLLSAKMMQSLTAGGNPIKTMLGSARNMVAGVLLIIPGVITDAIAVILLLLPIKNVGKANPHTTTNTRDQQKQSFEQPNQSNNSFGQSDFTKKRTKAANDDVIEGEFVEVKDESDHKT
jgi:UPF0716 protein FxsA